MNENFKISNSVNIKIDHNGNYMVFNSISRPLKGVDDIDLAILKHFSISTSLHEIKNKIPPILQVKNSLIEKRIQSLIDCNILVPTATNGTENNLAQAGFAAIETHHSMLRDYVRVNAYKTAIFKYAPGKNVLEVGCGTGILSIFACQAGANKVSAIEESEVSILAEQMFLDNEVSVKLYRGNSLDVTLTEPVDLIIHEILGSDPFSENLLVYIADAKRRFLKPGGQLLPYRIDILCVGIESDSIPSLLYRTRLEAREFERLYQIKFDPYLKSLDALEEINETTVFPSVTTMNASSSQSFQQPILTLECLLKSVNLNSNYEIEFQQREETELTINNSGRLGSILVYFRAFLDETHTLTTSPFAPRTHWRWTIRDLAKVINVSPGDKIALFTELFEINGRQRLRIGLV